MSDDVSNKVDKMITDLGQSVMVSEPTIQLLGPKPTAFNLAVAIINGKVCMRFVVQGEPNRTYELHREEAIRFAEVVLNAARTLPEHRVTL